MLFNSYGFVVFFPIVVIIYYIIPHKIRYIWLLGASYFFYMCWNVKYALLLLFSTLVTYASGLIMSHIREQISDEDKLSQAMKYTVAVSFILNLGLLFFFKYFNFACDIADKVLGILNVNISMPRLDLILPVGISFYIFQALSYTVDVYRGDVECEKNFLLYALYVSFFPQLVAGPIERSSNLLCDLKKDHSFSFVQSRDGLLLMLWGYFLKIVLADRIAIVVDTVYNNYETYPGCFLIIATILFAIQIYCDFAGYSSIAIGAAEILGVDLMKNFDAPYTSLNVAEFWRRWHISLTSWFRDYLYIPLGGNRKGVIRKWLNILIVFALSGLWHGASLHFIAWGLINGLFQIIGEMTQNARKKLNRLLHLHADSTGYKIGAMILTFIMVDFAWIFFRAESLQASFAIIRSVFTTINYWILFDGSLYKLGLDEQNFRFILPGLAILMTVDIFNRRGITVRKEIVKQDYPVRWAVVVLGVMGILIFGIWGPGYEAQNFIYFQF